jgi:hypothetical protein
MTVWLGDGWKRTRRLLGVLGFIAAFGLEAGFHVGLPIGIYGIVAGLLGLDIVVNALEELRNGIGGRK